MASLLRWVKRFRCEQHCCLGPWLTSLDVILPSVWEPWDSSSGTQVQEKWGALSDLESHTPLPIKKQPVKEGSAGFSACSQFRLLAVGGIS